MNVYTAVGNLGRDCRTASVSGTPVCNFTVVVKSGFGQSEQTIWIYCALWGKRAESGLVQYLVKGQRVAVSGELGTREYKGDDGSTRTSITLRVNDLTLCGDKQPSGGGQQQPSQQTQQQQAPKQPAPAGGFDDFDDSIPF